MQQVSLTGEVILEGSPPAIGSALFKRVAPPVADALRTEVRHPQDMAAFYCGVMAAALDAMTNECGMEAGAKAMERLTMGMLLKSILTGPGDGGDDDGAPAKDPATPKQPEQA